MFDAASLSLNSATVPSLDISGLVDIATTNSLGGLGLWRQAYADVGAKTAAAMIVGAGLRVSSVCRAGMFPNATAALNIATRDDNRRAVDDAHTLDADCLVVVCGAAPSRDLTAARGHVQDALADLAAYADSADVNLAVEPMHPMMIADRSVVTSLSEAVDLLDLVGDPSVGLALDAYHVWWDVDYPSQALRAVDRIHTVQISDWVLPIHHQLRSRGMPGEGSIDLVEFMRVVETTGYSGLIEVEVLSDHWAARPPQVTVDAMIAGVEASLTRTDVT